MDRPDDALGVEHDGEHEPDAGDGPVPVAQVEPLGGRVVDDAAGREHPGEDAAGDRRDAGEVGGGEHADADEDVERVEREVALFVAEHGAAEAGDERGDGEREDLDAHDVDAGAGGGPLVGADGEHGGAEPAASQQRDGHGDDHQHGEHDEAEREARVVGADARTEIEPEQLRAADVPAFGRHVVGVVEPHGLHRVGHGERHHGDEEAT